MPRRRKVSNFMSMSESEKKPIIEKRKRALFKQANEISVLCDSKVGIVMFDPSEGDAPIVWPSMEEATKRFAGFMDVPEAERVQKMVIHERYLAEKVNGEIEKLQKKEEEVQRKEMNVLMKEVIQGKSLKEMDARQLLGLHALAGEKMQELEKRKQDLLKLQNNGGGVAADGVPQPPAPVPPFDAWWKTAVPPPPTAGKFTLNDSATWFNPTMAVPPAHHGGEGTQIFPVAAGGSSSTNNGGGDGGSRLPPVPPFNAWWKTPGSVAVPPLPNDSATWFNPTMAAPPVHHGGYGGEGTQIFSTAAGSSSTGNGGRLPPVPQFNAWWNTAGGVAVPPPPTDSATWFNPTMAAPPPHHGGYGGEASYQHQMIFSTAAGSSSTSNNGGGNYAEASSSGHHEVPGLNQAWRYNFF